MCRQENENICQLFHCLVKYQIHYLEKILNWIEIVVDFTIIKTLNVYRFLKVGCINVWHFVESLKFKFGICCFVTLSCMEDTYYNGVYYVIAYCSISSDFSLKKNLKKTRHHLTSLSLSIIELLIPGIEIVASELWKLPYCSLNW